MKKIDTVSKLPWGIFAGLSAMVWSFVTIGLIAVFVVSAMMMKEVGRDDGLSQAWWLIPLYVMEGITVIGFVVSIIFYSRKSKLEEQEEYEE